VNVNVLLANYQCMILYELLYIFPRNILVLISDGTVLLTSLCPLDALFTATIHSCN